MMWGKRGDAFGNRPCRVVLFHGTHWAIKAESAARQEGITARLIPIPREMSSDCGVCLRHLAEDTERLLEVMSKNGIKYDRVEDLRG
ncbi:MAG: DUF3343 domain-containing protein [Candidatus Geothermincolales bacterium]